MFETLLKELGGGLSLRWFVLTFTPALSFWMASLGTFIVGQDATKLLNSWNRMDNYLRVSLVIAGLTVVILTVGLLELLQALLIRTYEGYWPGRILGRLRTRRTERFRGELHEQKNRFSELAQKVASDQASDEELIEYEGLELSLSYWPSRYEDVMPTRIGNILRAAEGYSADRYGLDAATIWPRLYFHLSNSISDAVALALGGVSALLRMTTLALVFGLIWVPYSLWHRLWVLSILCALGFPLSWLCYQGATQAAKQFNVIVRTAFDLHRFDLYTALHWPLPAKLSEEYPSAGKSEITQGQRLSLFLHRGQWIEDVDYKHPKDEKEDN